MIDEFDLDIDNEQPFGKLSKLPVFVLKLAFSGLN